MKQRTWFITGVSSGFGRQLTEQLLNRGDRVIGTVRDTKKITDLVETRHPDFFLRRAGRLPGELTLSRLQVGH
jgi:short-subunit dehydrogenase